MSPKFLNIPRVILTRLVYFPIFVAAASEVYLAPAPVGNDRNFGTSDQPVASPARAQELVRDLIETGLTEPVDVIFSSGKYEMESPLELRPEDSGSEAFPITWKAAPGATVVLSGGKTITGSWIEGDDGIWHVDLPGIGLGPTDWNFRQLFVDGKRSQRARFPNASEQNPFLYTTGGGLDHALIEPALLKENWGDATDAQLNMVPRWRFFNQWNTVSNVDVANGRINFTDSERHGAVTPGNWFWIEGVKGELDEPGEWFLDTDTGKLSFMPESGVDPNTLSFVVPYLNRIINAQGDVNTGTHVEHVHFDGFQFRNTSFTLGHIEARVHTDAAVMFENTNDSSVENCHFENIGGYALWLHLDSQNNRFDHNTVRYSGGGGVLMTGSRLSYMDDTKVYTPGVAASKVAPILNAVTHNTVEHCGKIRYYGGGVHLDSRPFSMSMDPGNYIAHNHFNDLSRNGVFAFRNQGGNVVEYNHIHNAMQTTIDGACIHFATMNHLNAPNFILNNWLYDIWGFDQKPDGNPIRKLANGVFLDWDSSNTTVKDNWIYNSGGKAVKVIWKNWNVVNSDNQSSSTLITPPFVAEVGPGGTATNAIDLPNNRLTGSAIHYTEVQQFSSTGTWTPDSAVGLSGLFVFKFLVGTSAVSSEAEYVLPIVEDGTYQISLLYKPGGDRASNAPISIQHADGVSNLSWNMKQGSVHGFAVEIGTYQFRKDQRNSVTLSTIGANGKVIADGVAFVKIEDNEPPKAEDVEAEGDAMIGRTLQGEYTFSDPDNDLEGLSRFQWYRSDDPAFDEDDEKIIGATSPDYTVQGADTGKFLFFEVTPIALTGVSDGNAKVSGATILIADNDPPVASLVSITGSVIVGQELAGSYTYEDPEGDQEGASIHRWYRSDDPILDSTDELLAGVIEVIPIEVKTSTALGSARLASNLFNASGMSPSEVSLHNLDGSQSAEPTTADGASWVTPSGDEAALLADQRVWFVADLGERYALDQVRVWNFQWNHSSGDLSNRGISNFDLYLRDSDADTIDGSVSGAEINNELSSSPFSAGLSSSWQAVLVDQDLERAPNSDDYKGESFPLLGRESRYLALVPQSYYGGGGVALGKVRVYVGQANLGYTPNASDLGKYMIYSVTPVAALGSPIGSSVTAVVGPVVDGANTPPEVSQVSISGTATVGNQLQGSYDYFDEEGDVEAGTSFQWFRSENHELDDGDISVGNESSYLVQEGDAQKILFFVVTPVAVTGDSPGATVTSEGITISALSGIKTLIKEEFSGPGMKDLNGIIADDFAAEVIDAGGASAWVSSPGSFLDDGTVVATGRRSAFLNLGSYINDVKGRTNGLFELSMTISETTGFWISLGFAASNIPGTEQDFTALSGMATILYREDGELDMWAGPGTIFGTNDGPNGNSGARRLLVTLDLTPEGGYDRVSNFGTVSWSDSILGNLGSVTYSSDANFGSILISQAGLSGSGGTISSLSLVQRFSQLEPQTYLEWIGGFDLAQSDRGFHDDPDSDQIVNGLEAWFGTHPGEFNVDLLELEAEGETTTLTHPLNSEPPLNIEAIYKWSTDLVEWYASGSGPEGGPIVMLVPESTENENKVSVVSSDSLNKLFLSVGVIFN